MFDTVIKLFSDLGEGGSKQAGQFDDKDYRVAATALLVHTAAIDGSMSEIERKRLHNVIRQYFDLDDALADELIAKATDADNRAIDLYQFTARLNRALDAPARARMVEMMWQIVYADGTVTEFEDNLIWRAADLLHVSREERIALRMRVAGSSA
jgi:uncharacterized tellurite resistance protein B-like protein